MFTRHGHWFAPSIQGEVQPDLVAGCSGTVGCPECAYDVANRAVGIALAGPIAKPTAKRAVAIDQVADWVIRYRTLKAAEKVLKEQVEEARGRILECAASVANWGEESINQDIELTVAGQAFLRRQLVTQRRLDSTTLRKDHPTLADSYTVESEYERLTIL